MKTIKHIVLGLLASLLFAAGFARAADRVDLLAQGMATFQINHSGMPSIGPCAEPCDDPPPELP